MHHLKETIIDGVKFVLIPEELYEKLVDRAHDYFVDTGHGQQLLVDIGQYEEHPHGL